MIGTEELNEIDAARDAAARKAAAPARALSVLDLHLAAHLSMLAGIAAIAAAQRSFFVIQ